MKLRYLSIIPILLTSCTATIGSEPNREKYNNVTYQFVRNDNYYKVKYLVDKDNLKEWNVSPNNVYYVYYEVRIRIF